MITTSNKSVSIYKKQADGPPLLITSGEVDSLTGTLVVAIAPNKTDSYFASWGGDAERNSTRSAALRIGVRALTSGRLSGYYSSSGKTKLYHQGRRVTFTIRVAPNHASKPVDLLLVKKVRRTWKHVASARFRLGSRSTVKVFLRSRFLERGVLYRQKATFRGDADHLGSASDYAYFKITR